MTAASATSEVVPMVITGVDDLLVRLLWLSYAFGTFRSTGAES